MNQIYCNKCRVPLEVADDGCTFCAEAKKHLVWPAEQDLDDAQVDAAQMGQLLGRILRTELKRVQKEQSSGELSPEDRKFLVDAAAKVNGLMSELRRNKEDMRKALKKMSFDEKAETIIAEFFQKLPQEKQRAFIQKITQFYEERRLKVLPSV